MIKTILPLSCLLFFFSSCTLEAKSPNFIQIRSDAFFPSSDRFTHIYGKVAPSYEIELSTTFNQHLEGWVNFDYLFKTGQVEPCDASSKIWVGSGSFGFKFPYHFCECVAVYVGLGPNLAGVWLKNKSRCGHEFKRKFVVGGVAKSGIRYSFVPEYFLDRIDDQRCHHAVDNRGLVDVLGTTCLFLRQRF